MGFWQFQRSSISLNAKLIIMTISCVPLLAAYGSVITFGHTTAPSSVNVSLKRFLSHWAGNEVNVTVTDRMKNWRIGGGDW